MRIDKSVWHMCGSARIWAPIGLWQWHLCHTGVQGMRANKFQHAATRCNTLQHAATRYNTRLSSDALLAMPPVSYGCAGCESEQPATHCDPLQHAATRCNTLQHSPTFCNTQSAPMRRWRCHLCYTGVQECENRHTIPCISIRKIFWHSTHLCVWEGGIRIHKHFLTTYTPVWGRGGALEYIRLSNTLHTCESEGRALEYTNFFWARNGLQEWKFTTATLC